MIPALLTIAMLVVGATALLLLFGDPEMETWAHQPHGCRACVERHRICRDGGLVADCWSCRRHHHWVCTGHLQAVGDAAS